jgi:hypothetical protein
MQAQEQQQASHAGKHTEAGSQATALAMVGAVHSISDWQPVNHTTTAWPTRATLDIAVVAMSNADTCSNTG